MAGIERSELLELYEEAPCGYLSTLPDGTIVRANGTLLQWTGFTREQLVNGKRFADLLTAGGRIYHETHYAPLLLLQGSVREIAVDLRRADGTRLPALVNAVLKRDADGRPQLIHTTVFDATDRKRYEHELVLARDRERALRERSDRLQRLTAALAAGLRATEIVDAVETELTKLRGVASVELRLLERAAERAPQPPHPSGAREGAVVLPLVVGDRALGEIVVRLRAGAELDGDDRAWLLACAGQCALALDRALLHAQETEAAHVLQHSLMESLPLADERVRIGAHYSPAIEAFEVGGDWHDAFPIGGGRIGVVVGDVVGRGIQAATAMGQLRSATRALGGAGLGGPTHVLEQLDRFAERLPGALMATLAYVELDPAAGSARFTCAGHPPPLLLEPGGEPEILWSGRTVPLGVASGGRRGSEAQLALAPGSRLLLYTDGLVERRAESLDRGFQRLAGELGRLRDLDPQPLVDGLVAALVDPAEIRDDVCAVCVELRRLA